MINIGNQNFNMLLEEIGKFTYVESEKDIKHNRVGSAYTFRNNINKQNVLKYLKIDGSKFKVDNDIDIIEYQKDSYLSEHTDDAAEVVVMVMLSDNFTGGTFVLNGNETNFKVNGDVIYIKGTELHHLEKIKSGYRKIMILYLMNQSPF